jgi:hypothetical protein
MLSINSKLLNGAVALFLQVHLGIGLVNKLFELGNLPLVPMWAMLAFQLLYQFAEAVHLAQGMALVGQQEAATGEIDAGREIASVTIGLASADVEGCMKTRGDLFSFCLRSTSPIRVRWVAARLVTCSSSAYLWA